MTIEPATDEDFAELAGWRYTAPYDFYDGDDEPAQNPERFFVAREDGEMIGFYYFEQTEHGLDYGLGLRPDLTGRGLGLEFFRAGLQFAREQNDPERIRLHVAAFNERAIKVYERAGFREIGRHVRSFDRFGDVEFITMEERR